jgi:hypothetical protein
MYDIINDLISGVNWGKSLAATIYEYELDYIKSVVKHGWYFVKWLPNVRVWEEMIVQSMNFIKN